MPKSLINQLCFCIGVLVLLVTAHHARAAQFSQSSASHAIMVDYDTGMVLFQKNADEQMPTSSMSKVMTMYMVFEALENGQLSLNTELPVSEEAWRKGGSKMFVEAGKKVAVEDLIRGVIVQSGNDATIVLAEGIAGSESAFAETMNNTAHALGMAASNFRNASGWPDPDHYSTPRDLATLGKALIRNHGQYYHYYSEREFTYNNIRQPNRNPLLYRDVGADGIKTGRTEAAGYGLIASGTQDGRRVVLVVNGLDSERERANESARLLRWGLSGFRNFDLFAAGETVENAAVSLGQKDTVPLVLGDALRVTVPLNLQNDLRVEVVYHGPLQAPVQQGTEIGLLRVHVPRLETIERPLLAGETIGEQGLFKRALSRALMLVRGQS